MFQVLRPTGWPRPKGYSNGVAAHGRLVFTAGVIGWDETETIRAQEFVGQLRQVLTNTLAILAEGGAGPEHIVRMTWFLTDRDEYLAKGAEVGAVYREIMGRNFPPMSVVQVCALVEPAAMVEIETTAVVPV